MSAQSRRRALLPIALAALALACDHATTTTPVKPPSTTAPTATTAPAPLPGSGPRASIDTPAEGAHVATVQVPVRGRAADLHALFVNSRRIECAKDGSFALTLEVPEGAAEIVVRDAERADATLSVRKIVVDLEAPVLELTEIPGEPLDGKLYRRRVAGTRATIAGNAHDVGAGVLERLVANDVEIPLAKDGTFRAELDVPAQGERTVELLLTDRAHNRARIVLTLVR